MVLKRSRAGLFDEFDVESKRNSLVGLAFRHCDRRSEQAGDLPRRECQVMIDSGAQPSCRASISISLVCHVVDVLVTLAELPAAELRPLAEEQRICRPLLGSRSVIVADAFSSHDDPIVAACVPNACARVAPVLWFFVHGMLNGVVRKSGPSRKTSWFGNLPTPSFPISSRESMLAHLKSLQIDWKGPACDGEGTPLVEVRHPFADLLDGWSRVVNELKINHQMRMSLIPLKFE